MSENVNQVFNGDSVYEDLRPTTNHAWNFPQREKNVVEVKNETRLVNVLKALISALLLSAVVVFGGLISVPFLLNGHFVQPVTKETSSSISLEENTTTSQLMADIIILKKEIRSQSEILKKQQIKIENLENVYSKEKGLRLDLEKEMKSVKNKTVENKQYSSKFSSSIHELRSNDRDILATIEKQTIQISNLNETAKKLSDINTIPLTESSSSTTPPEYCTHNIPVSVCLPCLCSAIPQTKGRNIYTCDCRNLPTKLDCKDYYESGYRLNGIYTMRPDGKTNVTAYCDQTDSGGGWVVIQRRFDGSTGFNRDWGEYKNGFGDFRREYYLGNENIHILTKKKSELKIDVEYFSNPKKFAKFNDFSIKSENEGYKSSVAGYSGNAGNYFSGTNGYKFTTWDKDNDRYPGNCASMYFGGWWFRACHRYDYLNGDYFPTKAECPGDSGIEYEERLARSMMKIRRR